MRPLNVFAYGGGAARELVPHAEVGLLRVIHSVSRQSLISAASGVSTARVASAKLSAAESRSLVGDLYGSLANDIAAHSDKIDLVLWDLLDERFGVERLSDGTYLTRSPERLKHIRSSDGHYSYVPFGTAEHFDIWCSAADQFIKVLKDKRLFHRTYVIDVRWAGFDENGHSTELNFGPKSYEANAAFAPYFEHLRNAGLLVLTQTRTTAASNHKWGVAPFHFHDETYRAVADMLTIALEGHGALSGQTSSGWDDRHGAPIRTWNTVGDFNAELPGRTHHVVLPGQGETYELQTLIQNNSNDTLLVVSHGALPRTKYVLPRFEWLASLESRPENLMFLADTSLAQFNELELAWFTGNATDNLTERYADLVARAAKQLAVARVLFLGGSGGGFASLALAAQSPGSRALVFNPQTNIRKYWMKAVSEYVRHIFPALGSASELSSLGNRTDVTRNYLAGHPSNHQVLYVQNDDDAHHIERHLAPFASRLGLKAESGVSDNGNVRLIVEHFASGHNMPYRQVLNPFVDLALSGWGKPLKQDPLLAENNPTARLAAGDRSPFISAKDVIASSAKRLIWLDTIFCDAETDDEIIDRYLARFLLTLKSLGHQRLPQGTVFRCVVHLSVDKHRLVPIIQEALDELSRAVGADAEIHFYEHPPEGYGVPSGSHVDLIKNPNKQPGRREQLFHAAAATVDFKDFGSVIRISMDDDDLFSPGHFEQLSEIADALIAKLPHTPSAAGLYNCYLGQVGDSGTSLDQVAFSRVIPGNKFFVIPREAFEDIAKFSPWSIPEYVDEEAVESFRRRGIHLTLVQDNVPTFIYMRRSHNLSGYSKDHYIDAHYGSQRYSDEFHLLDDLASKYPSPEPGRTWHFQPLPRTLFLKGQRRDGRIRLETNFSRMYAQGYQIAYYLMQNGVRVDTKWYSSQDFAEFTAPSGPCTARAFVRRNGEIVDRIQMRLPF